MKVGHRNKVFFTPKQHIPLIIFLLIGTVFLLATKLQNITASSQPLYWSEFTHIFDSSRIFSGLIYGKTFPLPLLDPGKALLDGLSLIPAWRSLLLFRLWTTLLSIGLPIWLSIALARRMHIINRFTTFVVALFSLAFLEQGPIYYHVLIAPALILSLYNVKKPILNLALVIIASLWTGICRINWIPFPGLFMAVIYLLETRLGEERPIKYFAHPCMYAASGVLFGFLSYFLYGLISGNPLINLDPSYNYSFWPLSLLPNQLYHLGILPGFLLISLSGWIMLAIWNWQNRRAVKPLRTLAIYSILAVYAIAGLMISIRIGGSFNLHNLDGYILLLLVVGTWVYFNKVMGDYEIHSLSELNPRLVRGLTSLIVIFPFIYNGVCSSIHLEKPKAGPDFAVVQQLIDANQQEGHPVLFMDHAHLLTFGLLNADPYPYFDKVFLMEMIMANQTGLINEFTDKIYKHDFSVILSTGEYYPKEQTEKDNILAPEENAWHRQIGIPIVDNYTPIYQNGGLVVYVPDTR